MPRVHHVNKARKNNPAVKRGESYYWWKFRYGGKRYSATRPRPSQLTQSAYYSTVRALVEQIEDADVTDNNDFVTLQDDVASELANLLDETQSSLDNMPEPLQYSPTGELLQERIDACENAQSEVESADEFDEDEPDLDDFEQECSDCNGTGVNPDADNPDEDDCETCGGTGDGDAESDWREALSEWQDKLDDWRDTAKDQLMEAVSDCEV